MPDGDFFASCAEIAHCVEMRVLSSVLRLLQRSRGEYVEHTLDIKAKVPYPAGSLSNFAPHVFAIDGVRCASMEGFLQSLKIEDLTEQERVCGLPGPIAQSVGRKHNWSTTGTLWWRGRPYDRLSQDYQALLDRAYDALFEQARGFRDALAAAGAARFTHTIGKSDPCVTILTVDEFCSRLDRLRRRFNETEDKP